MNITAQQVLELRQKTGSGMMDCKNALIEADGDMEKAIEILRKKGQAVASKRAEKTAGEGLVLTRISNDKKSGIIVEVNCETDFVANSTDFVNFANLVADKSEAIKPSSPEELIEKNPDVKNTLNDVMGKVGEKIEISRLAVDNTDNGLIVDYIHPGSKLAVLVTFNNTLNNASELAALGKDIAMQVAAMRPICVYREEVPKDLIQKEIEIYKELSRKEGKPEQILDKIAQGKLNKYYQENCLIEQAYIKDNSKSVGDLLKEFNTKNNSDVKIDHFRRYHLGDEKK
ncbi:MAG TPA: translation elongation factor Ts [Ignavibacteriaceae bacterium]|nr:translation elongation factor Ts [Ignavibacteriaceae bacterium]